MSYLNGPRINFWGGGSTNVDTANNDGNGIVDLVSASVTSPQTDPELIAFLRKPSRNAQGQPYFTVAGWNYYGDHQVAFMDAKVSSAGTPGAVGTAGPPVGLPVYLLGSVDPQTGDGPYGGPVMVDLDPTSSQTTRIYAGGLQIGGERPVLHVVGDALCHSHFLGLRYDRKTTAPPFLTPGSAFASGTFQLGFPKSAVVSYDASIPIVRQIVEAPGAQGIVVRFVMFEFMPGMSTDELLANYARNENDANPSLGRIVGSIGPWLGGEPATCPPGRLLVSQVLGGAQGLAWLDAKSNRLTLDLASTLQGKAIRQDAKANTGPIGPNVDYGDLLIQANGRTVATTPSRPDDWYVYGGVYDVGLSPDAVAALAQHPIAIGSTQGGLRIAEAPLRVYGDARNVYLDDAGGRAAIRLEVRQLGGPVGADTTIAVQAVASGTFPPGRFLDFPPTLVVRAGGTGVTFQVRDNGGDAGFVALELGVSPSAPNGLPDAFVNFRKYPADDDGALIAAGHIAWPFVYAECLRYYYVLFPGMSKRIPLNDQSTIQAVAAEILRRTSPAYRNTTLYMPLTRSLSPGKVALLRAFLTQQGG